MSGFIFASNLVVGKSLATEVAGVLEDTSLEPGSRLAHLNQVKMLCYLLCQYMEMFEDDSNEKSDVITTGKVNNDLFYILNMWTLKYILIDTLIYLLIALKSVRLWRNGIICLDCIQGRKNKKSTDMAIDWDVERENGVKTLLHLVSLNILRLWDPPIAEVEFVK